MSRIKDAVYALSGSMYDEAEASGAALEFLREDYGQRPDAALLSALESKLGSLPPLLAAHFEDAGSVVFEWQSPAPTPLGRTHVGGCLSIPDLQFMLDQSYWESLGNRHGPLFALDKFSAEWWAVLRPNSDHVWLHEVGLAEMHDTELTVDRWFDIACERRFWNGWLFDFVPAVVSDVRTELEEHGRRIFPSMKLEDV